MIENQEGTVSTEPSIEELKTEVSKLNALLAQARQARDNYQDMYTRVKVYIQNSIDNDNWTDDELDEIFWEELAEMLDLEITKIVDILITAEWSASVKIKRGQDVGDLDISVEEPSISRFSAGELSDVYERSFDVTEA